METQIIYGSNNQILSEAPRRIPHGSVPADPLIDIAALSKQMEEDMAAGTIKPMTALSRLQARYGKHLPNDKLSSAMSVACRSYGQTFGRSFVVIDPDTDRVLSSSECPDVIPQQYGNDIGWAMWQAILRTGPITTRRHKDYNERGELFFEVYALPRASYHTTQISRIRAVGDHILTFMWFDLDKFQLPEGIDVGQKRRLQGLYSPRYGRLALRVAAVLNRVTRTQRLSFLARAARGLEQQFLHIEQQNCRPPRQRISKMLTLHTHPISRRISTRR